MVLHEIGQVDKALQVFLQCLALDDDFHSAKRQVEAVSLRLLRVSVGAPGSLASGESVLPGRCCYWLTPGHMWHRL